MDDFKKFLSEQSDEQPYKILVISAEPTKEKMFHKHKLLMNKN